MSRQPYSRADRKRYTPRCYAGRRRAAELVADILGNTLFDAPPVRPAPTGPVLTFRLGEITPFTLDAIRGKSAGAIVLDEGVISKGIMAWTDVAAPETVTHQHLIVREPNGTRRPTPDAELAAIPPQRTKP